MTNGPSISDFEGMMDVGYESRLPVDPEDEFFHSIYIAGQSRKNESGYDEVAGKLQVRGVEYNLDKAYMIITHVKAVLAKIKTTTQGKQSLECFSYQKGDPPWYGTSGVKCGVNSAERAASDFCNPCRSQLVVAGIYCDSQGHPILSEEKRPTFVFVRGKGMKYSNVANYINDLQADDFDPIFTPVTEETRRFEKIHVNNKRFVTEIGITTASSDWGPKQVFQMDRGVKLPDKTVMEVLKITKKTLDKFNEKFDWSRGKQVTGYTGEQAKPSVTPDQQFTPPGTSGEPPEKTEEVPASTEPEVKQFTFEDIDF